MGPRLVLIVTVAALGICGCQKDPDPASLSKDVTSQAPAEVRSRPADPPIEDGMRAGGGAKKR